jgi:ferredoxin
MNVRLEQKIKDFAYSQGVDVVGIAGPERLDGPPSLDSTYTMKGARSIISLILPMDVQAIYDFLGKKSPVPHWLDQLKKNQQMHRTCDFLAGYIRSLGYNAEAVPPNSSYRRHPYIYAVLPSFSHRFGAIMAGIAGQGWSGNVMNAQYGAAIYIGTVVTDAVLESDPLRYSPRYFIDNFCNACRICVKTCTAQMFRDDEEEYVLLNGALHPRGKRRDINLCSAACFGLHSISQDRKWTTWGYRWDKEWMEKPVDTITKWDAVRELTLRANLAGDTASRFGMIKAVGYDLIPDEILNEYLDKHPENLGREEREKALFALAEKVGVTGLRDETILTCAHCSLVCGPDLEETAKRYRLLVDGGLVVRGPNGDMVNVPTYEEAVKIRQLPKPSVWDIIKGMVASTILFHKLYFGLEPKSMIDGFLYNRRLKKAVADRLEGHKDSAHNSMVEKYVP